MRVGYIGNFEPEHSTENHVAQAVRHLGHELIALQENSAATWRALSSDELNYDIVLWTRTGWPWPQFGLSTPEAHELQRRFLARAREADVPTVGYHLDRWWGLNRQGEVHKEPFFKCSVVITADGGHDARWKEAGVNHVWMPPGVSEFECEPGEPRPDFASDIAFVGSWQPGYHAEYPYRPALIAYLQGLSLIHI